MFLLHYILLGSGGLVAIAGLLDACCTVCA